MKKVSASILLLLFLIQTFSTWMWVLDYQLNKEYIANNLCINKARPQLHCNGKCQLAKKLAEEESNSKTSGNDAARQHFYSLFFKQDLETVMLSWSERPHKQESYYLLKSYTSPIDAVFHPPAV